MTRDEYNEEMRRRAEASPGWTSDLSRISAQAFEVMPERFTFETLVRESRVALRQQSVTPADLAGFVEEWQRREMIVQRAPYYVKTGYRPYELQPGVLS